MNKEYETEQKTLRAQLIGSKKEYAPVAEKNDGVGKFLSVISKYKDLQELDEVMIIELIDKIIVHEGKYIDGKRTQKIDIYYNFIGAA